MNYGVTTRRRESGFITSSHLLRKAGASGLLRRNEPPPAGAASPANRPRRHRAILAFALLLGGISLPVQGAPLNDTGIVTCSDNSTNGLPCPQTGFPGQDAEYGRDAAAQAGTLAKIGGGRAGFDFTKLGPGGNELSASATSWSCVRDNVTGLIWEIKTDDGGLRDKDNTYTWYNPDSSSNGGYAGAQNGGSCTGGISCDTYGYAQAVNSQGLCGHNDWRLPWLEELRSIVDYNIPYPGPTIDTNYFPNTVNYAFWSASSYASYSGSAWRVHFNYGDDFAGHKVNDDRVRLVRGGQ